LAVFTTKVRDWWGNWRMPTFSLWNHSNFNGGAGAAGVLSQTSPQAAKEEADKLAKLNHLLEVAKTHTTWTITESYGNAVASMHMVDGVLTYDRAGATKEEWKSVGFCARYVIIALTESTITGRTDATGLLHFGSGSEGGPPLENAGWENVTNQLPDARWAAPGDVIVYQWSESAMQSRRKMARWNGSPQAPNMSLFNHGHIDIRSYEAYISDHIPNSKQPKWCDYTNVKIYRSKYHDPLPELRMRAFLRCIREFECQEEPDDSKRYNMLNTALPNQKERRFSGFAMHPWAKVEKAQHRMEKVINGKKITTDVTASGAYQIQFATWQERVLGISGGDQYVALQKDLFLGANEASFTPDIQDRVAIAIIARVDGNPLADIRKGLLEEASKKLRIKWSSLPGAKENETRKLPNGRAMDNAYLTEIFNKYLNELIAQKAKK
jgi:muramidase (phage lysozyme)